jgi:ABC-type sugar transport system permease subunit
MKNATGHLSRYYEPYLWMSLALVLVLFSTLYPLVFSIDYSLWKTDVFSKSAFVGLQNYADLFRDAQFWGDVKNSVVFTLVGVAITVVCGFILSALLREKSKINSLYRTLILVPWVTNEIVFGLMWLWVLNPLMSPLYYWANLIGVPLADFLGNKDYALATVTVINAWRAMGFALVMTLAAFATISREVEEAAEVDGCSGIGKLFHIYLPLVKPIMLVTVIVLTISFFNIVGFILLMTGGGPDNATELLSVRLYKEGFKFFNIGIASTVTTIMLLINVGLSWGYKQMIIPTRAQH